MSASPSSTPAGIDPKLIRTPAEIAAVELIAAVQAAGATVRLDGNTILIDGSDEMMAVLRERGIVLTEVK